MADVFCEEYASSLNDLTCNSKPHISVLTMLAEENSQYAPNVVRLIEQHLQKVRPEIKLPAIYLIDSIVKNVRGDYLSLFTQNLVSTFCSVFEKVDEKTRLQLYKLRQTWVEVFPNKKLYAIDVRVHQMDPAWPISAPTANQSIHVNPKFLKSPKEEEATSVKATQEMEETEMRRQLIAKQQELLKLQQQKLELELLQAKNRLEEQKRMIQTQTEVEPTVQETNKLFEANLPVASASIVQAQVQANSVIPKDPRSAKGPRPTKEPKAFRIPNLSSAVTKAVNNVVGVKLEGQIKSEVKQIASGVRNMCDMAAGTFFAKQTLASKDHGARNDVTKALKKKDSDLPAKVSSKKKSEREWKKSKNELNAPSPNKKSPDAKKRKEKSKKDTRDASKIRKGERKLNAKKKEHEPNKLAEGAGRRTNFRSRRNYRSNRDRSESPEPSANSTPKAELVAMASSPKSEGAAKDGKYKKKLGDVVVVVDESKENKMDSGEVLIADVDLRKVKRDVLNNDDSGAGTGAGGAGEEPPNKRMRRDDDKDTRITNLFGSKDQDYRQMSQNDKKFLRNDRNSWAQYKAEHPDEFKNAPFPARGNRPDFVPYRSYDMDLRMPRDFDPECGLSEEGGGGGGPLNAPPGMRGARGRSNDPRLVRRGFGRPARQANNNNRVFEDRNLRRHPLYQRYQMEFENTHPSEEIPNALQLDKQGEIMRQADQQLKCGLLTREQHHELLNQLAKLYELQVTRQRQREEQLRERIMCNRTSPDATETAAPGASTTTSSAQEPEPEPEAGARTKVSMLSIFQRENAAAAGADAANPNRTAVAADDGDRLIAIDGKIMKLKYHDGTAIILEGSKVQEILFRGTRREIFVDREIVLLGFEGDEQTFYLNSKPHTLKFGTPTHEIYVDRVAYEARFGGPPIRLMLDGEVHEIRMGGPPPDVELKELGADMKAQIAHLIDEPKSVSVGAKETIPGAEQKTVDERTKEDHQQIPMDIDELNEGEGSIVTNVAVEEPKADKEPESASTVTTEPPAAAAATAADVLARVSPHEGRAERPWDKEREQFASSSFKGRDKWREREKPARNVREYNTTRQMDEREDYWPRREDEFVRRQKYYNNNNNNNSGNNNNSNNNNNNNNNNRERGGRNGSPQRGMGEYGRFRDGPRRNFNPMYFAEGPRMRYDGARAPYDNRPRGYDGHPRFEMRPRADLRHTGMRQPLLGQYYGGANQFNLDQAFRAKNCDAPNSSNVAGQSLAFGGQGQPNAAASVPAPSLDMSELFQKLVANGIIPSTVAAEPAPETNKMESALPGESEQLAEEEEYFEEYDEKLPLIEFTSECLKTRYPAIIGKLCRGIQCSSCGLRFTSEQTEKYGQHLDWHFRQNRRERDSAKKAMSRKWYYDVQDWIQFEEIEDMEERARSLFEEQANEDQTEQTEDVQTIPVAENDDDNVCAVCGESFEQFWDEDKEEWHLRDATRIDGKTYHPICYEDIRNISQADISADEVKEEPKQVADSWKSLEENESKLKRALKEEKENVAVAVAEVKIKQEPVEAEFEFELAQELVPVVAEADAKADAKADVKPVVSDDGKASVDIGQEEEKELCIKEELIDNRMESISSHLIDDDNVELDVKLNEDKRNVDENLVCPVKTEEVVESLAPTCRPVEIQDDGMVEYVPPKLPGFTILPPAVRGTELSGLCSIM